MLPSNLVDNVRRKRFERFNQYIRKFLVAVLLLFATTITGVVGFMCISDYSFAEAFYMTIITLSTVGYGEVKPLGAAGQLFASFLIVFNLGIFAYGLTIISSFLIEGEMRRFLQHYTTYKKIKKLENHTIVCGFGRHGKQVCQELVKNELPFVIVEPSAEKEIEARELGYFYLRGDANDDEVLLEAGIEKAKAIVVTYSAAAFNVYTVLTARELNPSIRIITRAADQRAEKKLLRAGADYAVLSEVIGGFYMATLINQPNVVEFFSIISNMGEVAIHFKEVEFGQLLPEFQHKSISELDLRGKAGVNIIGMRYADGKYDVNPRPDVKIGIGMALVVLGDKNQIDAFEQKILR
jgi:voltage-gated potassium channel